MSFANLLEGYMLSSIRKIYDVRIPRVRRTLINLAKYVQHRHPLIEQAFETDRRDLFIEHLGKKLNLYKEEQILIPGVMELYLERIERGPRGLFKLYPFVTERKSTERRMILISPAVGFGKPIIAGTGISTAVVASRFNARESIGDLAPDYDVRRSSSKKQSAGSRERPLSLPEDFVCISTRIFKTANQSLKPLSSVA